MVLTRGKCGLSPCTTGYLVGMAVADLLSVITEVIFGRISFYYFPGSYLEVTPVCSVIAVSLFAATDCSVWFTVMFTFDRFIAICCQKLKTKYCRAKTATAVLTTTSIVLCIKNAPFFFTYEPAVIIHNVPWDCKTKPSYYTEAGWVVLDCIDKVFTPLVPFVFILLLNALIVRHILVASRVRKRLRDQNKGENQNDPEMESRRKSVIVVFTISGSFILLWLVYVLDFMYYNIVGTNPTHYTGSLLIFKQVGYLLSSLSSCTNTFIYGVTQSKFREQLKSIVKYPAILVLTLINKPRQ